MKKLIILLMIVSLMFMSIAPNVFAVFSAANIGPTTDLDGDVNIPDGKSYYINKVLLSIDMITTEDLIVKADFADEDWGDLSVVTNEVTIDEDVIDKANFKDEDWGELTVATNEVTINNDVIGAEHFATQDWGDVNINAEGVAEVQDLTIADEAQGDILYRGAAGWIRLAKDVGKYLKSGDTPSWDTPAGAGDIDSVGDCTSGDALDGT
ncbi:unnamed protein product, partial [marine sediment metagenome]